MRAAEGLNGFIRAFVADFDKKGRKYLTYSLFLSLFVVRLGIEPRLF